MSRILQENAANVNPLLRPFWNKKSAQECPRGYKQMRIIRIWRPPPSPELMGAVRRHHS